MKCVYVLEVKGAGHRKKEMFKYYGEIEFIPPVGTYICGYPYDKHLGKSMDSEVIDVGWNIEKKLLAVTIGELEEIPEMWVVGFIGELVKSGWQWGDCSNKELKELWEEIGSHEQ